MWGLSQGAYISAAAASRSKDVQFIVVVGAQVADGMLFYYRDNLFRRYGLSDTLRDVSEKAQLATDSLFFNLQTNPFSLHSLRDLIPRQKNTCIPRGVRLTSPCW